MDLNSPMNMRHSKCAVKQTFYLKVVNLLCRLPILQFSGNIGRFRTIKGKIKSRKHLKARHGMVS